MMKRAMIAVILSVCSIGATPADELAWVDAYNVAWTTPSKHAGESMPAGGKYAECPFRGWKYVSNTPARSHHVRVCLHVDQVESQDAWDRALQELIDRSPERRPPDPPTLTQTARPARQAGEIYLEETPWTFR